MFRHVFITKANTLINSLYQLTDVRLSQFAINDTDLAGLHDWKG